LQTHQEGLSSDETAPSLASSCSQSRPVSAHAKTRKPSLPAAPPSLTSVVSLSSQDCDVLVSTETRVSRIFQCPVACVSFLSSVSFLTPAGALRSCTICCVCARATQGLGARLIIADDDGNLSWSALNPDGSVVVGPTSSGVLRPGSKFRAQAAARSDTLVVAGNEPAAVYVFDGQSSGQSSPVLRNTITELPDSDCSWSVTLSPDGQSLAIGTVKGNRYRRCKNSVLTLCACVCVCVCVCVFLCRAGGCVWCGRTSAHRVEGHPLRYCVRYGLGPPRSLRVDKRRWYLQSMASINR
jgi:hypothetical protein